MSWAQVRPAPAEVVRRSPIPPWLLGSLPVLVRTQDFAHERGWLVGWAVPLLLGTLALVLVGRRLPRWFPGVAAAALAAFVLALGTGPGTKVAILAVAGTAIWAVGLGVVPFAAARLHDGRAWHPALPVLAVADVLLVVGPGLVAGAAVLGLACAVALVGFASPRLALGATARAGGLLRPLAPATATIGQVVQRVAAALGRGALVVVMLVPAVVVTVIWAVHRILGHDPLASPTSEPGRWVQRLGTDPHPDRYYSAVAMADLRSTRARLSRLAVSVVAFAVVAGVVALAVEQRRDGEDDDLAGMGVSTTQPVAPGGPANTNGPDVPTATTPVDCPEPPPDPVLSQQPDFRLLACERGAAFSHGEHHAATGFRLSDFDGKTVNLRDGLRTTWSPPTCSCRRLRVWWFGGSAAWGEGQRDDEQSLPSALARAAWEDGVALDIENRAMPTYTFGQETRLFGELTTTDEAPDLVIFYNGANDLIFQGLRHLRGEGDDESDIVLMETAFDDLLRNGIPVRGERTSWSPPTDTFEGSLTEEDATDLAGHTLARYTRNLDLATRLAASIDRPMLVAWQPLLAGSPEAAGPPDVIPEELREPFAAMVAEGRRRLPAGVEDMGDVYDGVTEPVFFDLFHTGEAGATLMAEALWQRFERDVRAAQEAAQGRPPS